MSAPQPAPHPKPLPPQLKQTTENDGGNDDDSRLLAVLEPETFRKMGSKWPK